MVRQITCSVRYGSVRSGPCHPNLFTVSDFYPLCMGSGSGPLCRQQHWQYSTVALRVLCPGSVPLIRPGDVLSFLVVVSWPMAPSSRTDA